MSASLFLESQHFSHYTYWPSSGICNFLKISNYILQFGLVGFNGISTIEGYLMPNSVYTYILDI